MVRVEETIALVTVALLAGPNEDVAVVRVLRQLERLESELREFRNLEQGPEIPDGIKGFTVGVVDEFYNISLSSQSAHL